MTAPDPGPERQPMGVGRWIGAIIGVLIMVFSGGCTLLFLGAIGSGGGFPFGILLLGGVPFAIGFLIWWLSAKSGR